MLNGERYFTPNHTKQSHIFFVENQDGLRPVEYALHLGVSGLALEMLLTKPIYTAREEYDGTKTIIWSDITDYELNEKRRFQSPLIFLTMYNIDKIDNPYFQGLLFSG